MIEVMTERAIHKLETPLGLKETYLDKGYAESAVAEAGYPWSGYGHDYDDDGNRCMEYYSSEEDLDEGISPHTACITTIEYESDEDFDSIIECLEEGGTAYYEDQRGREVMFNKHNLKGRTLAEYLEDQFAILLIPHELARDYICPK